MPKIYMPNVQTSPAPVLPPDTRRIAIDPITRIEGHLRLEVTIANGKVTDAWSTGSSFRGLETVMKGRDPRDAWIFAERVCGVCTTVHAIASVRAVENALGITVPDNARLIRNLMEGIQFVQDHVIHFYHLHALDWVDLVSAIGADPAATSRLAQAVTDWPNNSTSYFTDVKNRLATFANSGQLGLFANAYWGHPAYKLPPEANLLAVAHYLEALDWQREIGKMHAILGGKSPHPQTYLVGGMATALDLNSPNALNGDRLAQLQALAAKALDFVSRVYLPDLLLVASYYPDWASLGAGPGNYLSFGDFPQNNSGVPAALWLPQGVVYNKNLATPPQAVDQGLVKEYVARSWYAYADGDGGGKHPLQGTTMPKYTGPQQAYNFLDTDGKYSWLKAPRYNEQVMEVGPLARMIVAYANAHQRVRQLVDETLATLGVPASALFSTLGRVAARGVETQLIAEQLGTWIGQLQANMQAGDLTIHENSKFDPSTWPAEASGWGATEAPRGALGHWVVIKDGVIDTYQMVVSTTWNGSPRDAQGQRGAWEQALIGTPVADAAKPVEVLRTIHSYDPCMSCSVHIVDAMDAEVTRVQVVE
jgi:hydrogenase large subunit